MNPALLKKRIRYLLKALFGSKQGIVVDSHGENHLTNNGGVTSTTGKVGSAGQFTAASSQYLSIADNTDLSMGDIDFTIGAWVYLDSKTARNPIVAKWTGSGNQREYALTYEQTSDRFTFQVSSLGTGSDISVADTTLGSPSTGTWYFVVGWHDSVNNIVGISTNVGAAVTAAYSSGVFNGTSRFSLGEFNGGANYCDGRIDQAFVIKRVLTAQERTDFYNSGNGLAYSALTTAHKVSLVAWWELEPLPASLPVDVGGPLTVTDTNNVFSQSGGAFRINGSPASNDRIAYLTSFARTCGRALAFDIPVRTTIVANIFRLGWYTDAAAVDSAGELSVDINSTTAVRLRPGGNAPDTVTIGSGSWSFLFIMRATGGYLLIRNGTTGAYTVHWVHNTGTAALFAKLITISTSSHSFTLDNLRVLDLGTYDSRFASDYALATSRLTSPAAGATTTSTADAVIDLTLTTLGTGSQERIAFRNQDTNNFWCINIPPTGNFDLYEVIAGVFTLRASATGVIASGHRIVVVTEGAVIKGYSNNVLRWTYSSATNFQTATGVVVKTLQTGAAISEIIAWPRTLSLPAGV